MKHWQKYIHKHAAYDKYTLPATFDYGMVVVIPCYDEPDVLSTLNSLKQCSPTKLSVCVLVVVNSSESSADSIVQNNLKTYNELIDFAKEQNQSMLSFHTLLCENLPRKHAGVGLARKIGMEWALRGFFQSRNKNGVIVSLDADCTVSENYFQSIESQFSTHTPNCLVLNFRHRILIDEALMEKAINQYEQYIWYYRNALKAIGFPFYYYTIGSSFAVSADVYVRVGGIGRQQGGEDFYFLQKVFQLEKTVELMDTFVYPEARLSSRIPFGTGPALDKIIASSEGILRVYSVEAFEVLKTFFDLRFQFFKQSDEVVQSLIKDLHVSIQHFLIEFDMFSFITECNKNSSTTSTFEKRFFHHFNAFIIIKYMNYVHDNFFELIPIQIAHDKIEVLL